MLHIVLHDVTHSSTWCKCEILHGPMSKATSFETLCKKTVSDRLKNFMYKTTELYISYAKSSRPTQEMWKCKVKLTIISRFKLFQVFALMYKTTQLYRQVEVSCTRIYHVQLYAN